MSYVALQQRYSGLIQRKICIFSDLSFIQKTNFITLLNPKRTAGYNVSKNNIEINISSLHSSQNIKSNNSSYSSSISTTNNNNNNLTSSNSKLDIFFQIVSPLIATAPCVSRVAVVYGNLPPTLVEALGPNHKFKNISQEKFQNDTYRWLRFNFGTLSAGLQQLHATNKTNHWGIYISYNRTYVVKAYSIEEANEVFDSINELRSNTSLWENESLLEIFQPIFPCFTPPEPLNNSLRDNISFYGGGGGGGGGGNKKDKKNKKYAESGMFTPQMLVPYIPTFFIPMKALLLELPEGYTEDHIERIFAATGTLEIVTLEEEKFVRLHGGKRLVDFLSDNAGEISYNRWKAFQPDPFLCEPLRRLLPPSPRWCSLRALITGAPKDIIHALKPLENYKTILYFAQMQHVFSFTPEGEGAVCWIGKVSCLSYHDSPTPSVVSEFVGFLSGQCMCINDILNTSINRISDYAKIQIIIYYGTLMNFFNIHGDVFYIENDTIVGLVSDKGTKENITKSSEDKLEDALVKKDRRTAQKLRRRIALERNPDNPYADREVLLDAILRYLPQKRSISLNFLLKSLPPALTDFLPSKPISLFQQAPEKVKIFEYRFRNRLHLIRPGIPLPPGVLREDYSELELLSLVAAELQQQPRLTADLFGRLPYGAREVIRMKYKNLLELLRPYPHFFTVVFKDSIRMDSRNVLVTLIQMPPQVTLTEEDVGSLTPEDAAQQQLLEEEDREALKTLPEEILKTLRLNDKE